MKPATTEYVLGFCFDERGRDVLLIRKNKPDWQAGFLNGLGGKIEFRETPQDAMAREFFEECGLAVPGWTQFCIMQGPGFRVFCFYASLPQASIRRFISKTDEKVELVRIDKAWGVLPNLHWLIPMALTHYDYKEEPVLTVTYPI